MPELTLKRGLSYKFLVRGGNNPHSAENYHPLIITDEPHGGYDKLTEADKSRVRVLAGVEYSRRGKPQPTSGKTQHIPQQVQLKLFLPAGPLCLSQHRSTQDRRFDDDFPTFRKFNNSLTFTCEEGDPGILEITPNTTWPDTVYYNSFTQPNMGWKINIVDSFNVAVSFGPGLWFVLSCLFVRQLW